MVNINGYYMVNDNLVGGWPTPLKNDGLRQLGWMELPNWMESHLKFHGSSHHQPGMLWWFIDFLIRVYRGFYGDLMVIYNGDIYGEYHPVWWPEAIKESCICLWKYHACWWNLSVFAEKGRLM